MDPRNTSSFFELRGETDRTIAIIGISWLDSLLETCLRLHLRESGSGDENTDRATKKLLDEVFNPEGPLGSFSAKCKMSYLLGIVGPITLTDLKIINDIRREFAHYVKVETPHRKMEMLSFLTNTISNKAGNLKSRTSLRVMVKQRPNDSPAARAYISAVDAIARGLRGYSAAIEESAAPTSLP